MKRFFILTALMTALVGCQTVDSNTTDSMAEVHGLESLKSIEFVVGDTSSTKGPAPITTLSQFNVSATTGSAGSEASKLANVVFSDNNKSGVFKSDAVWPSSDPGYHFYASNVAMTHTASGQTVTISSIDKDVVCAYLPGPNYKVKNELTFNHILARVGTVTFTNLSLCSDVKLSMKYSGSGTYNISTGVWSGVGSQSSKELTTADNDFWIIPGSYDATLTYTDANGNPQSKTISQNFLAGKVNNINAKLDDNVIVSYGTPEVTFSYSPASHGAAGGTSTPSVTYKQTVTYASGKTETVTIGATSITYSGSSPGFSLATDGKVTSEANQGNARNITVTVSVTVNGKTGTANATINQNGDSVDYYDAPTGLSVSCGDIPASGGTMSEGSVSGKATQVVHYKSGATSTITVSVSYDNWTSVSASNLQKTEKPRTKVGTLTLTYTANDKSNTASCDVYQAANACHRGTTNEKDHTRTGEVTYGERNYTGEVTYGEKSYGNEYVKNTSYGSEVQDADTFGEWSTYNTTTYKYDYAVSVATTSWSPGALSANMANAITASHLEKPQYDQRRTITHNYHTPYTQHYYKDWTRTNSRSYTCLASQNCNYIEYRTDTFDSGATEYVEENKSHTETWPVSETDNNYSKDNGSDWVRDASGSTPRSSDGGYGYQTTYGDVVTPKTDSPTVSSDAAWLSWSSGTMYVTENKGSSRSTYLRAKNGSAEKTCHVTQAGATFAYALTCTGSPISLTVGDSEFITNVTVKYLTYINGKLDSEKNVTSKSSFSTGNTSVAKVTSTSISSFTMYSVTGVAAGTTKIYASYNGINSKDNNDSGVNVTVKNPDVITYKLTCTGTAVSVEAGKTASFTPKVTYYKLTNGVPDSGTDVTSKSTLTYSTGNSSVATVPGSYSKKTVTGVAAGTTKIYASYSGISSKDNGDSGISVTVTKPDEPVEPDDYEIEVD